MEMARSWLISLSPPCPAQALLYTIEKSTANFSSSFFVAHTALKPGSFLTSACRSNNFWLISRVGSNP